jgi:hypothetical protein
MGAFLTQWLSLPAVSVESTDKPTDKPRLVEANPPGVPWCEWKAAALNRLFQEQGVTGQPGRITASTARHGERPIRRVGILTGKVS